MSKDQVDPMSRFLEWNVSFLSPLSVKRGIFSPIIQQEMVVLLEKS